MNWEDRERLFVRTIAEQVQDVLAKQSDSFFDINSEEPEPVLGLAELKPVQEQWTKSDVPERLSAETL